MALFGEIAGGAKCCAMLRPVAQRRAVCAETDIHPVSSTSIEGSTLDVIMVSYNYRPRCAPGVPMAQLFLAKPHSRLRIEGKNLFDEAFFSFCALRTRAPDAQRRGYTRVQMSPDEPEVAAVQPSLFGRIFALVGVIIAITALAALTTWVLVTANKWQMYRCSIFGLAWGVCARLFQWSVHRGIKTNLASDWPTDHKRKMLGEQLHMLRVTKRLIEVELVGSAILLIVQILGTR
jgi:hypothetical protein